MADPEVIVDSGDVDMGAPDELTQPVASIETAAGDDGEAASGLGDAEQDLPPRATFTDYLKSPVVELVIGTSEEQTTLTAHQGLLVRSPFFEQKCAQFADGTTVRPPPRPYRASHDLPTSHT
ncbi:hypothetical protein LTR66_014683 [Elasticomyces elasticus]|nr:hypothetical protein LTR28_013880 [Elasticomyces elasticus]KAK4942629.1 hypothetical protein LTR66_014683 [Elasticomyces elasticus]